MKDSERRKLYAAQLGGDALERQVDATKHKRKCCGTWKHEPHAPECSVGNRAARRAR